LTQQFIDICRENCCSIVMSKDTVVFLLPYVTYVVAGVPGLVPMKNFISMFSIKISGDCNQALRHSFV